jgi:hypothetical protein
VEGADGAVGDGVGGVEDAGGGVTFTVGGVQTPDRQIHSGLGGFAGHADPSVTLSTREVAGATVVDGAFVAFGAAVLVVAFCSTHAPPMHDQPAPGWTPRHPPAPLPPPAAGALDPGLCHAPF